MADWQTASPLAARRTGARPAEAISPTLTLREIDDLRLFALTADFARHPELVVTVEAALGAPLPKAGAPSGSDVLAIWQTPSDILFVGQTDSARMTGLRDALSGAVVLFDDVTHGLAVLELSGPEALALCPPPKGEGVRSRVGRFADLRVTQLFPDDGTVRLIVEAPEADYLWARLDARMKMAG